MENRSTSGARTYDRSSRLSKNEKAAFRCSTEHRPGAVRLFIVLSPDSIGRRVKSLPVFFDRCAALRRDFRCWDFPGNSRRAPRSERIRNVLAKTGASAGSRYRQSEVITHVHGRYTKHFDMQATLITPVSDRPAGYVIGSEVTCARARF